MARSLIGGLVDGGQSPDSLIVSDPLATITDALAKDFGIRTCEDNIEAVNAADIVVLAVKPQQMKPVVSALGQHLQAKLVISIAAGVQCVSLKNWAGAQFDLVRCMPNTPSLLRCGATGLYADASVSSARRQSATTIMSAAGKVAWVDHESELDAITALSGSGPAYFFLLIESMTNAAVKQGLSPQLAASFAIQTALGAARMADAGEYSPTQLRENVTSPGGTTAAALNSFNESHFNDIVERAMQAARNRSEQLGRASD